VRDGASRGGFLAEIIMAHIHAFARVRECAREFGESSGVPLVVESPLWALERQKLPWPTSARMSSSCREKFCGKVRQALPRAFRVCLSFSFSLSLCLSLSLSLSRPFRRLLARTFIGTGNGSFSAALAVIVVNTVFRRSLI